MGKTKDATLIVEAIKGAYASKLVTAKESQRLMRFRREVIKLHRKGVNV